MRTLKMTFVLGVGDRAMSTDHEVTAPSDEAGVRKAIAVARKAAAVVQCPLLELHVGDGGVPFFNWAKDYSFSLDTAADLFAEVPA